MTRPTRNTWPCWVPDDHNPALWERLERYDVPPWPGQPPFDRVYIFQIETKEDDALAKAEDGSTLLYMPEKTRDRNRAVSPRGILCAAGLSAMDHLDAHGFKIGDIVHFAKHALNAFEVYQGAKVAQFQLIRDFELNCNEDLMRRLMAREVKPTHDPETGRWSYDERQRFDPEVSDDAI